MMNPNRSLKRWYTAALIMLCCLSGACSPPEGLLMPVARPGMQISSTRAKGDTVRAASANANVTVSGMWQQPFIYRLTITVENTGQRDLKIDFRELRPANERIAGADLTSVAEMPAPLSSGAEIKYIFASGDDVSKSAVTVGPRQTRVYGVSYTVATRDKKIIEGGETVEYKFPSQVLNGETGVGDIVFSFECVPDNKVEFIQTGTAQASPER